MLIWVACTWWWIRGCLWQWHTPCSVILVHIVVVLHWRILLLCYSKKLIA